MLTIMDDNLQDNQCSREELESLLATVANAEASHEEVNLAFSTIWQTVKPYALGEMRKCGVRDYMEEALTYAAEELYMLLRADAANKFRLLELVRMAVKAASVSCALFALPATHQSRPVEILKDEEATKGEKDVAFEWLWCAVKPFVYEVLSNMLSTYPEHEKDMLLAVSEGICENIDGFDAKKHDLYNYLRPVIMRAAVAFLSTRV